MKLIHSVHKYVSIYSYGESESVSAVLLPASILLMSFALTGLVERRKIDVALQMRLK